MTTPRIEEYGEWDIEVDGVKYAGKRSLTQAHQAGIDEVVEVIKNLPVWVLEPTDPLLNWKKGQNDAIERVLSTLDDTIKTLQDNK